MDILRRLPFRAYSKKWFPLIKALLNGPLCLLSFFFLARGRVGWLDQPFQPLGGSRSRWFEHSLLWTIQWCCHARDHKDLFQGARNKQTPKLGLEVEGHESSAGWWYVVGKWLMVSGKWLFPGLATAKWLMVSWFVFLVKDQVVGALPNGLFLMAYKWGGLITNHLLTILGWSSNWFVLFSILDKFFWYWKKAGCCGWYGHSSSWRILDDHLPNRSGGSGESHCYI